MDQAELQRRFGAAVLRYRLEARLAQEKLAENAGVHRTHISLIERGGGMPTLAVIHKIATALGVPMSVLMAAVESDEEPGTGPPPIPRGRPPREQEEGDAGEG